MNSIKKITIAFLIRILFLSAGMLINSTFVFAQKNLEGYQKKPILTINTSDGYVRFTVFNKNPKVKFQKNKPYYYWYAFGKILSTMGGFDGQLLDGLYSSFFDSDNLKEQGHFAKGLKTGNWMEWYKNGSIKEESHWSNGLKDGITLTYTEDGILESKEHYKDGQYNGTVIQYKEGKIILKRFYKNGIEYFPRRARKMNDTLVHKSNTNKGDQPLQRPKKKKNIFAKMGTLFEGKKKDTQNNDQESATPNKK